ncbi:multidrug effflux MFS transporter [Variovorax sp.]|uniref:multidrug effflux MFS transporter n=1 Tax=Variovorax sp. TaxID=1871043 RepID=UPI002D24B7F5|nr:multidrug effflux MFS transporter [Variovorax sp.]HYP85997.1 multidrug effflux MFS transporter [Variovorax sp.]
MASPHHAQSSPTPQQPTAPAGWLLLALLSALMAFTSLSTDIYLPAMPQMQRELQGNVELTITGFLIGFALAQLIWGPVSDRIGRRKPLFIGVTLYVIGSVGCALSRGIEQIVFWRVFQAFGACTGPMLARAMVRDLYARTQAAQVLSTLTVIMAIAPIFGPLLGGQIIRLSSWHSIFWLLASLGALMVLALRWLPESYPAERRSTGPRLGALHDYRKLLSNATFMRYTLCVTFFYVSAYAFITGSPKVYIDYFGIDAQHYGWLFAANIVGLMALSFANRQLVRRFSIDTLLRAATAVAATAMLIGFALAQTQSGGLVGIAIPIFVFFSTNGIVAASATVGALDGVPGIAGSAAALIGSLQYGSGIASSLILAVRSDGSPQTLAGLMALFAFAAAAMAFWPIKTRQDAVAPATT